MEIDMPNLEGAVKRREEEARLEKLIVRCVVKGIIRELGASYLLEEVHA